MSALAIGVLALLICVILLVIGLATAPTGYEDESGFHRGEQKK